MGLHRASHAVGPALRRVLLIALVLVVVTTSRAAGSFSGAARAGIVSAVSARPLDLTTPLSDLPGVAGFVARGLAGMGLTNVGRLLAHLPMRHERLEAESTIDQLQPDHLVSARGEIASTRVTLRGKRPRFEAVLTDHTGRLDLVWFNQAFLRHNLMPGLRIRVEGKARRFGPAGHWLQLVNPKWQTITDEAEPGQREARIRPVYSATERVNSQAIEKVIRLILPAALPLLDDHLPAEFRRRRELVELRDAYRMQHAPDSEAEITESHRRLAYDELLMLQLGVHLKRARLRERLRAPALPADAEIDRRIRARFPFALTPAQEKVVGEIARDLAHATPAHRLIQGDVGSGKTVVALYALLLGVAHGNQGALMAPTEILAEQHFTNITAMLEGSQVKIALLTGAVRGPERETLLGDVASGRIDLVIGTHALLTEDVKFASLAAAVIDEQHRFGVAQRAHLRAKAEDERSTPHVLVMTATPIPRTLAVTLFGDLDISVIEGLPPGRKPVRTRVVLPDSAEMATRNVRAEVYEFVRQRISAGEQAFIVVPAIDTGASSGDADVRDLRALVSELEQGALRGLRLAGLHGRLARATRERIMHRFRAGQLDALVATTVIEVGVDIPNATVMVVEHADRFGLAQLHQLRGRVGRGSAASVCVLIGTPRTEEARRRLAVMEETGDGFVLAERDLEIRGPGELLGTRQSGLPPFKVADLTADRALLDMARRDAAEWVARSPGLGGGDEVLLRRRLLKQYGEALGLTDAG